MKSAAGVACSALRRNLAGRSRYPRHHPRRLTISVAASIRSL
jgi:hypothetical protein